MRQPNESAAPKTPGVEPVENEISPKTPEPERIRSTSPASEYLTIEDKMKAEVRAFDEGQKQKLAAGKISGPEFREQASNFDAEQLKKFKAGYYDNPNLTAARPPESVIRKHNTQSEGRGDRPPEPNASKNSKDIEPNSNARGEMSDAKAERYARLKEQFGKFDKELTTQQPTRSHSRGGRD